MTARKLLATALLSTGFLAVMGGTAAASETDGSPAAAATATRTRRVAGMKKNVVCKLRHVAGNAKSPGYDKQVCTTSVARR